MIVRLRGELAGFPMLKDGTAVKLPLPMISKPDAALADIWWKPNGVVEAFPGANCFCVKDMREGVNCSAACCYLLANRNEVDHRVRVESNRNITILGRA